MTIVDSKALAAAIWWFEEEAEFTLEPMFLVVLAAARERLTQLEEGECLPL